MRAITNQFMFPIYQDRAAYKTITGREAPAYDPTREAKRWEDPSARTKIARTVVYEQVFVVAQGNVTPMRGADGKPMLEKLVLSRNEAATVNFWEYSAANPYPPAGEVPAPLKPLAEGESYVFIGPMGDPMIKEPADEQTGGGGGVDGFNSDDRETMSDIRKGIEYILEAMTGDVSGSPGAVAFAASGTPSPRIGTWFQYITFGMLAFGAVAQIVAMSQGDEEDFNAEAVASAIQPVLSQVHSTFKVKFPPELVAKIVDVVLETIETYNSEDESETQS